MALWNTFSVPVYAASESDCLKAGPKEAIKICERAILEGNTSLDVYTKLSKSANSLGQYDLALSTVEKAKGKYPKDKNLAELEKLIRSNIAESEYIESRQKNLSSAGVSKAKLKIYRISCLRKTGAEAIQACNNYLTLAEKDIEVLDRKASLLLEADSIPEALKVYDLLLAETENPKYREIINSYAPETESGPPETEVAVKDTVVASETRNTAATRSQASPTPGTQGKDVSRQEKVKIVKKIQLLLSQLGYRPGTADGIAGSKTMTSLNHFFDVTSQERKTTLDNEVVQLLEEALALQATAESELPAIDRLFAQRKFQDAIAKSKQQLALAPWSKSLSGKLEQIQREQANWEESQLQAKNTDLSDIRQKAREAVARNDHALAREIVLAGLSKYPQSRELSGLSKAIASDEQEYIIGKMQTDATKKIQIGEYDEALALLENGINRYPDNKDLPALRSEALLAKNTSEDKAQDALKRKRYDELVSEADNIIASVMDLSNRRFYDLQKTRELIQATVSDVMDRRGHPSE